nr:hypothetical protein [Methylomarinum sp. Ch1-1]MDP4519627.1 hypothetical protein [Methylomarinum sp. Ch1-1]
MSIEASGLLQLFSGLQGLEYLQRTGLQDGVSPEQFSAALAEQIELLRQAQDRPAPAEQASQVAVLQGLAAFDGKQLPPAIKKEVDIDLDATLQALAEVLKNLEDVQSIAEPLANSELTADAQSEAAVTTDFLVSTLAQGGESLPISPALSAAAEVAQQQSSDRRVPEWLNEKTTNLSVSLLHKTQPMPDETVASGVLASPKDGVDETVTASRAEKNDILSMPKNEAFETERQDFGDGAEKRSAREPIETEAIDDGQEKTCRR